MNSLDEQKSFTFTWTIENYAYCGNDVIESPKFGIHAIESKWYILLFPRGLSDGNEVAARLRRPASDGLIETACQLAFLSKDGSVLVAQTFESRSYFCTAGVAVKKDLGSITMSSCVPQDKLTIRCRIWKAVGELKHDSQCFARTRINIERRFFLWNVPQFSSFRSGNIHSKHIKSGNDLLFHLNLFLDQQFSESTIRIQLVPKKDNLKCIFLHLMIVDNLGNKYKTVKGDYFFQNQNSSRLLTLPLTQTELMAHDKLYLPNDVLSLQCDIIFSVGKTSDEIEPVVYISNSPNNISLNDTSASKRSLIKDMKYLLHSSLLSDVTLKTSTSTFRAHKNILSARSPVFKEKFLTNTAETIDGFVDMEDLDSNTVSKILHYIYTDELEDLELESAHELRKAADKYKILALIDEFSAFKSNSCASNGCETLILEDAHRDEPLAFVQNYVREHNIVSSEGQKILIKTDSNSSAETVHPELQRTLNTRITPTSSDMLSCSGENVSEPYDGDVDSTPSEFGNSTRSSFGLSDSNSNIQKKKCMIIHSLPERNREKQSTPSASENSSAGNINFPSACIGNRNEETSSSTLFESRSSRKKTPVMSSGLRKNENASSRPFAFGCEMANESSSSTSISNNQKTPSPPIAMGNNMEEIPSANGRHPRQTHEQLVSNKAKAHFPTSDYDNCSSETSFGFDEPEENVETVSAQGNEYGNGWGVSPSMYSMLGTFVARTLLTSPECEENESPPEPYDFGINTTVTLPETSNMDRTSTILSSSSEMDDSRVHIPSEI